MKVRYIGEEDAFMSGKTYAFGREFRVGETVEVSGDIAERCARNRYFEVVEDAAPAPEPKAPQNRMMSATDSAPDLNQSKARLIALADERGVKIDRRWSAERIAQAIKEQGAS
jgi:hypothetical protein